MAMLFGSRSDNWAGPESDIDLGVLDARQLSSDEIFDLGFAVMEATGSDVDVVDMFEVPQPITKNILKGIRLFGSDECFAQLYTRHLIEQEDFGRLRHKALAARVAAWTRK